MRRRMIASAISDLQKNEDGVRVTAEITNLSLADIAYDSKTLRMIAEASGTINVTVARAAGTLSRFMSLLAGLPAS